MIGHGTSSRYSLLLLSIGLLAVLLLLAQPIRHLPEPNQRVMGQFYLSIALVFVLSFLLKGAALPSLNWRFFIQPHTWGDGGRLYALFFLIFAGPALLVVLIGSLAASALPYDATFATHTFQGEPIGALSEKELMNRVLSGDILPPPAQARAIWTIQLINGLVLFGASWFALVFLARLVPFFFWRAETRGLVTLAKAWQFVRWRSALLWGSLLMGGLTGLYISGLSLGYGGPLFAIFIGIWALGYTHAVSPWVEVKICGLKTYAMVQAALQAGADYIGFVFVPSSPRFIDVESAKPLIQIVKANRAKAVGLWQGQEGSLPLKDVLASGIDILQVHGDCAGEIDRPLWYAVGVSTAQDLPAKVGPYDRLLLDAKPPSDAAYAGGHGTAFDWSLLANWQAPQPWMLAGGLTPDNVAEAIRVSGARAVDVSSGVEHRKGEKDADLIRAFIKNAKAASA